MKSNFRFRNEDGSSMITLVMGLSLSLMVTAGVGKVINIGERSQKTVDTKESINLAKLTIMQQMDCKKSVGIDKAPQNGLNCKNYRKKFYPRDSNGDRIDKVGSFKVQASCPRNRNELVFTLSRSGFDPLTKKPWSRHQAAKDLFAGTSDFCHDFFSAWSI